METSVETPSSQLSQETTGFYRQAMLAFREKGVPFLVGGAYAFARYTGIVRHTKDFDVFVHPRDFDRAMNALAGHSDHIDRKFPHWLGKAYHGDDFVDVIFSSGNGVARVDQRWFEHAVEETVLELDVQLCPAEEMIWSKSFILERERFDGGDVAHLIRSRAEELDWDRLLERFGDHWRVLFTHLLLFGFIYPGERDRIPRRVMEHLARRLQEELAQPVRSDRKLCQGTILSRSQFLIDVEQWGYRDARLEPLGNMSAEELKIWTAAAREEEAAQAKK